MQVSLLILLALAVCLAVGEGRGIWGSRKKREEVEEQEVAATGFEASRRAAAAAALSSRERTAARVVASESGSVKTGFGTANFGNEVRGLIETYINMMEQAISTPDFQKTVTPEVIRNMLAQMPGLFENPQVAALMDSPEFTDPDKLMDTVRMGISSLRAYTNEIVALLNSPDKMTELIAQLPVEFQGAMYGMMKGDSSGVLELLDAIPNLTSAQKDVVKNLLSGNSKGLEQSMKSALGDQKQVEEARQQLLANPEMIEMMGIDASVLNDKKKFSEMMAKGMEALGDLGGTGGGDAEDFEAPAAAGKLFGRAEAA